MCTYTIGLKIFLDETGWDSLETRRYKHRMITFYKMVKGYAPSYLQTIVPPQLSIMLVKETSETTKILLYWEPELTIMITHLFHMPLEKWS